MAESRARYFASAPTEALAATLQEKLRRVLDAQRAGDTREAMRQAYSRYYLDAASLSVQADGEAGQLAKLRVNQARRLARALHALVSNVGLSWRPQAANQDAATQQATILSGQVLEHAWKVEGMESTASLWLEVAILAGAGFVFDEWDTLGGRLLGYEDSETKGSTLPSGARLAHWEGAPRSHVLLPWHVAVDSQAPDYKACDWHMVPTWRNRWDLAEAYGRSPEGAETDLYEKIALASDCQEVGEARGWLDRQKEGKDADSDLVPVWHFFHRASPVLPFGRYACFTGGVLLKHGRLTDYYEDVPVHRLAMEERLGTPEGYTAWWDTLAAQQVRDALVSSVVSNNLANATQTVAIAAGAKVSPDKVGNLQVLYVPSGINPRDAVSAIQLTQSAPETYELIETLKGEQQELLGLNDVALGSPERGGSGTSYALLAGQAKEQASPTQKKWVAAVGSLGMGRLRNLRKHVTEERVVSVAGKASRHLFKAFKYTGKELGPIDNVFVEVGNPLEQTVAGRMQLADMYKANGWLQFPEDLQTVVDTGRLDASTNPLRQEMLAAESDVEVLMRGEAPAVHAFHNHPFRAQRAAAVLSNPQALEDEAVVGAVFQYVGQHYLEFYGVPMDGSDGDPLTGEPPQPPDPLRQVRLRALLGQVAPSVLEANAGLPPPMPGAPMGMPPPPGGAPPDAMGAPTGQPDAMGQATQPGMPTNPLTGQDFNAADGGGAVAPTA